MTETPPTEDAATPPPPDRDPTSRGDDDAAGLDGRGATKSLADRVRENRSLLVALVISLAIHTIGMVGIWFVASTIEPAATIEFDSSVGVALLSRAGLAPTGVDDEAAEPPEQLAEVTVEPPPEGPVEPSDQPPAEEDPPADEAEDEATDEEVEDEQAAEDDSDDEPAEDETEDQVEEQAEAERERLAALEEERRREREQARRERREQQRRERQERERREREAREEQERREREERERAEADAGERDVDPASLPPGQRYPEGTLHPVSTDVGMWGPEGARVVAILRNDRVRESPHRDAIVTLLSSLPDWQMLLGRSDIDPIEDVDAMLIASSDPRYINRTFLAAVHRIPPETIVENLARGYPGGVDWETRRGRLHGTPREQRTLRDPRVFFLPRNDLLIFTRPEYLDPLLQDAPEARGLSGARRLVDSWEDGEAPEPVREVGDVLEVDERGRPRLQLFDEDEGGGDEGETTGDSEQGQGAESEQSADSESGEGRRSPRRLWARPGSSDDGDDSSEGGADSASGDTDATAVPNVRPTQEAPRVVAAQPTRRRPRARRPDDQLPLRDAGWIQGLVEIADFGGTGDDGPAVVVTMNGFSVFRLNGMGSAPEPRSVNLSMDAGRQPTLSGRFVFADESEVEAFIARWPNILAANRTPLLLSGLYGPLRDAEWTVDHNEGLVEVDIGGQVLERVAQSISVIMRSRHGD